MSTNTLATLSQQYENLKIQMSQAEDDLSQARRSGYPLEVERLEKVVSEFQNEKEAINLAISTIVQKENARLEREEKEARWKILVGQCREAKKEAERLAKALEVARREHSEAQAAADRAEITLTQHQQTLYQPADYATDEELAKETQRGNKLKAELERARFVLREANGARSAAQMIAIKAANEFSALAAQEFRLRPLDKNPKTDALHIMSIG